MPGAKTTPTSGVRSGSISRGSEEGKSYSTGVVRKGFTAEVGFELGIERLRI